MKLRKKKLKGPKHSKPRRKSSIAERSDEDNVSDTEITSEEDEEQDDESHGKLLQIITKLDKGKKKKKDMRTEPSSTVSEVHLNPKGDDKVYLGDLVGGLKPSASAGALKKKIARVEKGGKSIQPPLPKPQMERVQRGVAYAEASQEVGRWQEIVKKNREAEHLEFPRKEERLIVSQPSTGHASFQMKPTTSLEKEIAALIQGPGSQHNLSSKKKALTEAEEKALKAMDLEKAMERRHELQKMRALQSFYERKSRRQNKIKSKKFHRLKKRANVRAAEKMAENESIPESEVERAEAIRVKERMTLRHHNKSKWARSVLTRGQKDPGIRKAISEQVKLGKELSRKVIPKVTETVESENDEKRDGMEVNVFDSTNVWLTGEAKIAQKSTSKESASDATLLDPSKVLAAIESDDEETEESMANVIEEAFANDDVVEQFVKDKEDDIDEQQPKEVDLTLPGWGAWGGPGTTPAKKSVDKKIVKKAPDTESRQDSRLPHVIIREESNKKMKKHAISELPFPYTSREQLERALCAPVGQHWNTAVTFHENIKPRVETLMGTAIGPMEKGKAKAAKIEIHDQKKERQRRSKKRKKGNHQGETLQKQKIKEDVLLTV